MGYMVCRWDMWEVDGIHGIQMGYVGGRWDIWYVGGTRGR